MGIKKDLSVSNIFQCHCWLMYSCDAVCQDNFALLGRKMRLPILGEIRESLGEKVGKGSLREDNSP